MFSPARRVCLSVYKITQKCLAWIWMKCCVSTDVGTWTNWLTVVLCRMHRNVEFSYVGKIPRTGIGRLSKQRRVVLRHRNTVVGGKWPLLSALLVVIVVDCQLHFLCLSVCLFLCVFMFVFFWLFLLFHGFSPDSNKLTDWLIDWWLVKPVKCPSFRPSVRPCGVNIFKAPSSDLCADVDERWHVYSTGLGTQRL